MPEPVKLSSPATSEFWEIPVLFEDNDLLALDKPAGLPVSPDRANLKRPSLIQLLHRGIERGAPWAKHRGLTYLMYGHRLDTEASGIILLAKNKPALVTLAAQFTTLELSRVYLALTRGTLAEDTFATDAKLAPHPLQMGVIRVDPEEGKRSHTTFTVKEKFNTCLLLECRPTPDRRNQVRVHLKSLRLPLVGDPVYGGPGLFLSKLKPGYHLKKEKTERPLLSRPALHMAQMIINQPVTGAKISITAPWPKDMTVAIKYLRRYAATTPAAPAV